MAPSNRDITEIPKACPQCGSDVWDNTKKPKPSPKSPDAACRDKTGCGWAGWLVTPLEASAKAALGSPVPRRSVAAQVNTGPGLPGAVEGDPGLVADQGSAARKAARDVQDDDAMLMANCLEAAVRLVRYTAKQHLTDQDDIVFTGDNICSVASTLFIETRKSGR